MLTQTEADTQYEGWRYQSDFPNQGTINTLSVASSVAGDTTQKLTVKGLTTAGAYAEEDITLTGTTPVLSTTTTYDELWYCELDAVCTGTVTVKRSSDSATITSIAIGSTTSGTDLDSSVPDCYIVNTPHIEWLNPPDDDYTVYIRGGALPSDFTTPTSLGTGATITITVTGGAIATATPVASGSGYYVGDVLTVSGGTTGTVTVATLTGGAGTGVATVTVTTPGSGYTAGTKATTSLRDQTIDSLMGEFHDALAHGAAALAETADIEAAAAQNRLTTAGQLFVDDITSVNNYLNTMSRDRAGAISVESVWDI
jgi:hypothetical protein